MIDEVFEYKVGEIYIDQTKNLWVCQVNGRPKVIGTLFIHISKCGVRQDHITGQPGDAIFLNDGQSLFKAITEKSLVRKVTLMDVLLQGYE